MSDNNSENHQVFLSYSRQDQLAAQVVVELLNRNGYSVFWDLQIRNGTDWRQHLEAKLHRVKAVLVLWSNNSVSSEWVLEEAEFGKSRQTLVAARLDGCVLPFGFGTFQTDDLSELGRGTVPSGMVNVISRVEGLVKEGPCIPHAVPAIRTINPEQVSISDHERDCKAILLALIDQSSDVVVSVRNGYRELESAQNAVLFQGNERVSSAHYASAAEHFGRALDLIMPVYSKARIARDDRSVDYFLSIERANCLVFAAPGRNPTQDPIDQAIEIYERLSFDERYKNDVPVNFRLGCALLRKSLTASTEASISAAIRVFRKARRLATEASDRQEESYKLLLEGQWIFAEIARQLGVAYYRCSEVPGMQHWKRRTHLADAIQETRAAIACAKPHDDPNQLFAFTVLKAQGNLLWLLAQQSREGEGTAESREEIKRIIAELKTPACWDVVQNQWRIVDNIAFAAATIGDWETAFNEAERNVQNFASQSMTNGLDLEEAAMEARAKEIQFFAGLCLKP